MSSENIAEYKYFGGVIFFSCSVNPTWNIFFKKDEYKIPTDYLIT